MDNKFKDLFLSLMAAEDLDRYKKEMSLLVIKSLMPMEDSIGSRINYERYIKELDLWTYYRQDYNASLKAIKNLDKDQYFKGSDDSLIYRLLPIVVANTREDIIVQEAIKNTLFTTANPEDIFTSLGLSLGLKWLAESRDLDYIIDNLKDRIINFSQQDFKEDYGSYLRIKELDKAYSIDFETKRIRMLDILNGREEDSKLSLNQFLKGLSQEDYLGDIGSCIQGYREGNINPSYQAFADYLMDLRKSRIAPESLRIDKYVEPDIFQLQKGDKFYHSLLKEALVIDRQEDQGVSRLYIKCRSGEYIFKKDHKKRA